MAKYFTSLSAFIILFFTIYVNSALIPDSTSDNNDSEEYKITDLLYLDIYQSNEASDKLNSDSIGTIIIGLFGEIVPITTRNFKELAPIYENTKTLFHRIIPDFVIQAGDIDNKGGHSIYGENGSPPPIDAKNPNDFGPHFSGLIDENFIISHDRKGRVSVANAGPNTGGSQFFICMGPTNFLDGKHVVFGQVLKGMEIAEKIVNVERDSSDKPINDVFINYAYGTNYLGEEQLQLTALSARENESQLGIENDIENNSENSNNIDLTNDVLKDTSNDKSESLKINVPKPNSDNTPDNEVVDDSELTQYQKNHPSGLGGSSKHFVLLPFILIVGLVGFMSYKNRRTITTMVRGPRYRRIQSVN